MNWSTAQLLDSTNSTAALHDFARASTVCQMCYHQRRLLNAPEENKKITRKNNKCIAFVSLVLHFVVHCTEEFEQHVRLVQPVHIHMRPLITCKSEDGQVVLQHACLAVDIFCV